MKAHKIEILVIDFEDYGVDDAIVEIEQSRNLHGTVLKSSTFDIGEWDDDHPLNYGAEKAKEWLKENEK